MNTELEKLHSLHSYINRCKVLNTLKKRICELEDSIYALDKDIEEAEMLGVDAEQLEELCASRNNIDLTRIELSLRANEIEKDILLFEKAIYLNN